MLKSTVITFDSYLGDGADSTDIEIEGTLGALGNQKVDTVVPP